MFYAWVYLVLAVVMSVGAVEAVLNGPGDGWRSMASVSSSLDMVDLLVGADSGEVMLHNTNCATQERGRDDYHKYN